MKLSIIVPNYNNDLYIKRCIISILKQKFTDFELIIIDDGSNDESKSIIKLFKDKRIKLIEQYNQNAAVARNRGLEIAKGELIYFLDSDDELFDENTLKKMIKDIGEKDLLIGNYIIIDKNSNKLESYHLENDKQLDVTDFYKYCLISPVPSNKLYKKSVIDNNGLYFDNVRIGQDLNFYLKYLSVVSSIEIVDYNFYKYRILDTSMTRSNNINFMDIYNTFSNVKKYYKMKNNMNNYSKYVSLVELINYNTQFNKTRKLKKYKQRHALYNFFKYCFSTINMNDCYKCKLYYSLRFKIFIKKILYFI
ncbi:MAG: glycosyltransferase [Bacilli bacterium]|nr:glycosyltransferase [Bacilli bacterium]